MFSHEWESRASARHAIAPLALVLSAGVLAAGCEESLPSEPVCEVESVTITGLPDLLPALQPVQLSAEVVPAGCADQTVAWSATGDIDIDATGRVTGTHLGVFTVRATVDGVEGSQSTTVTMAPHVADSRWAVAWVNDADEPDYAVNTFYSYSTADPIRSTRSGPGTYAVRFPGLASMPGQRESIHVSAYGGAPRRCRVISWGNDGADLLAQVHCHDFSGALADSRFDILVAPAGSTQGRSAFVVSPPTYRHPVAAAMAHNSSEQGIGVEQLETGHYRVTFEGLSRESFNTPERETFHVTAYGEGTNWCKIQGWDATANTDDVVLWVDCYSHAGDPADAQFSVLMLEWGRAGHRLGYAWANQPSLAAYTPSAIYNFNSTDVMNTASRTVAGTYVASWPGLERDGGSTAETNLVTAYGGDAVYCQVSGWSAGASWTRILCYAPDGSLTNSRYTAIWIE